MLNTAPVIDGYEILERLDEGGMGSVHRAKQLSLDREVAIKVIHRHLLSDEKTIERFFREGRLAARLEHPNIVRVHELGKNADGQPFLSMELLRGETLKDRLLRGPVPQPEAVSITCQILDALAVAHTAGVMHRDIKPGNVHIGKDNVTRILDFGIAHAFDLSHLSSTGATAGTPSYMSPEQAKGERSDHRADLYSVGIVLYEMLAGVVPFQGDTPIVVAYKHVQTKPPPLPHTFPAKLRDFVENVLEKDPAKRFQSAKEMKVALQHALQISDGATKKTAKPAKAVANVPERSVVSIAKDRSVRWPLTICLAACLFLIVIFVVIARSRLAPPQVGGGGTITETLLPAPTVAQQGATVNNKTGLNARVKIDVASGENLAASDALVLGSAPVGLRQSVPTLKGGDYIVDLTLPSQASDGSFEITDVHLSGQVKHGQLQPVRIEWKGFTPEKPSGSKAAVHKNRVTPPGGGGVSVPKDIKCPHCGHMNIPGSHFCSKCGLSLTG